MPRAKNGMTYIGFMIKDLYWTRGQSVSGRMMTMKESRAEEEESLMGSGRVSHRNCGPSPLRLLASSKRMF